MRINRELIFFGPHCCYSSPSYFSSSVAAYPAFVGSFQLLLQFIYCYRVKMTGDASTQFWLHSITANTLALSHKPFYQYELTS